MKLNRRISQLLAASLFCLCMAPAGADQALPASQVISAIQAAVAAQPGLVKEVEVEEEDGRTYIEVDIVSSDGQKFEVKVDPVTSRVIEIEIDTEDEDH